MVNLGYCQFVNSGLLSFRFCKFLIVCLHLLAPRLVVSAETPEQTTVVSVDADALDNLLTGNPKGVLVKFTVPWSVRCQQFAPVFRKAAENLFKDSPKLVEMQHGNIPFVEVDMTKSQNDLLSHKYGIRGFPTILFFHSEDGYETRNEYSGSPDAHQLIEFVTHMATPVVQPHPSSADEDLSVTLAVMKAAPQTADLSEAFKRLAKEHRDHAYWHIQTDERPSIPRLEVKHKGESVRSLTLSESSSSDESDMRKFFNDNKMPLYGLMNRQAFQKYAGKPLVWVLPEHNKTNFDEVHEGLRPLFTKVAEDLRARSTEIAWSFAASNTDSFRQPLSSMFNVNTYPQIVAQKRVGDKEYWKFETSPDSQSFNTVVQEILNTKADPGAKILNWLVGVTDGKIERSVKSEPIPDYEPEPGEPKIVVAKNLEQTVFSTTRDVLLNVFAPWCGHCKNFSPEFRKVARKIHLTKMEDKIVVAQLDGTANEACVDELQWDGFPTIFFVKAGTRRVIQYNSPNRQAETVYKWVVEHSTHKQELEEELGDLKIDL